MAPVPLYAPAELGAGIVWDTATVNITRNTNCDNQQQFRVYELRAHGTQDDEEIEITLNGNPVNSHLLTTNYQMYSGTIYGDGEIGVEFINDDGVANGRDVRLDYIDVDGERRDWLWKYF